LIGRVAPDFSEYALVEDEFRKISLSESRGKWVVLFFYPADFSFVCPTELSELADNYERIKGMGGEVISVSTDTKYAHKAWHDSSETIRKIRFPMLADPAKRVSSSYNVLLEEDGLCCRATFLIDPEGRIRTIEYHDNNIGRSTEELIRKLEAAKYVSEHDGEACPMNWKAGQKGMRKGIEMVGKI